ncbi:ROK family protein [Skermania sp. ID1734]|uniref:ROK family transcriptional regulator n=1 Tax=Skermania sp. ID1734 TaxID=2597516 RepID=UPI00117F76A7|nr:ROK family protein [Skermania sp. ID1734]TSD94260.1 ROK family protein [Skermania sp. ID1734]
MGTVPARFFLADNPAAVVLRAASASSPTTRDVVSAATGLSAATVNRAVAALLDAGLLRERADLTVPGAVGRPRIPFEVNQSRFVTVGIHIGASKTRILATDLRGQILGGAELVTPKSAQRVALETIAVSAAQFLRRFSRRTLVWAGVATGGRIEPTRGEVDHPRLGWQAAPVGAVLGQALNVPVTVAAHVEAMAAAELLFGSRPATRHVGTTSSTLYFYSRQTVGLALVVDGKVYSPSNGPLSIAHFPTGSGQPCECGRKGCLEVSASDASVLRRAVEAGLVTRSVDPSDIERLYRLSSNHSAHELLVNRAQLLAEALTILRDVFNPDHIILGGQTFTADPVAHQYLRAQGHALQSQFGTTVVMSRFGNRVQDFAATVTSLSAIRADPLAASRRW